MASVRTQLQTLIDMNFGFTPATPKPNRIRATKSLPGALSDAIAPLVGGRPTTPTYGSKRPSLASSKNILTLMDAARGSTKPPFRV